MNYPNPMLMMGMGGNNYMNPMLAAQGTKGSNTIGNPFVWMNPKLMYVFSD
jgi:hypothetical protein